MLFDGIGWGKGLLYNCMGHNSTGDSGWGFDFEREVSVAFLVLMMSKGCVWLSDEETIVDVWPQVNNGMETDDIRVRLRNVKTGSVRNLYVQCKSTIELSASESTPFGKSVTRAVRDYVRLANERREEDCLFAIASGPLSGSASSLVEFLDAVHTKSDGELREEFSTGESFAKYRRWVEVFLSLAKKSKVNCAVTNELVMDFLRHYYVFQPDIKYRGGLEEAFMLSALRSAGADSPNDKLAVIRSLVACKAKSSSRINRDELMEHLRLEGSLCDREAMVESCGGQNKSQQKIWSSQPHTAWLKTDCMVSKPSCELQKRLAQSPGIMQDWFVDDNDDEGDKVLLTELFGEHGSSGCLYPVLREMAKLVEEEKYRLEVCRVALKLLRYQRQKGNLGIVFDFLSFVFAPQTSFDSKNCRWRPQVMRLMFDFDAEIAWLVLLGQIVRERMPPISFDDKHAFGAADEGLISVYQKLSIEIAARDKKKLCDIIRRLPLVDGNFLECVLNQAKGLDDSDIVSALLNAWAEIVEWPFFSETRACRADAILSVARQSLHGDDIPILVRVFDVNGEGAFSLENLRKELLKDYLSASKHDISAVRMLAERVRHSFDVGRILAEIKDDRFDGVLFPVALEDKDESMRCCMRAYAWTRFRKCGGLCWVQELGVGGWTSRQKALLYALLPTEPKVWHLAEQVAPEAMGVYWQNVKVYFPEKLDARDYGRVIHELTHCGRVADALTMWSFMKQQALCIDHEITMEMLEGFANCVQSKSALKELFHKIQKALAEIHLDSRKNVRRISEIEKFFISELGGCTFERIDTSCCSRRMADDAESFVDVVRASMGHDESGTLSKAGAEIILRAWNVFPGVDWRAKVNQDDFCNWFAKIRDLVEDDLVLKKNCYKWIGEVLWCLPEPNEGMFSLRFVWDVVNAEDGASIRTAYQKRLKDSSALTRLFGAEQQGESYLDMYRRYAKESYDCGYGNVSLIFSRAQLYLESLPSLK